MEKKKMPVQNAGDKKKYYTKLTGMNGEEKKLLNAFRKCSAKDRQMILFLTEKTAVHMTDMTKVTDLMKK